LGAGLFDPPGSISGPMPLLGLQLQPPQAGKETMDSTSYTAPETAASEVAAFEAARSMAVERAASKSDGEGNGGSGTAVVTKTKPRVKRPNMYRVLLLNDDYTPMEFVVHVLIRFFNKNQEDATRIMLHVHQNGVGECGIYTYEIAETKVTQVMDFARKHQHPLQCVMEKK
jgi:ATP-dependent Clp protease adaptor protein ClpS